MPEKDFYKILGVGRDADTEQIKAAFRNLAKQYHPDVHEGDKKQAEEKFKEIGEAYKILSNPETRRVYDTYGYEGMKRGAGGFSGFETEFDVSDLFSDISDMFGGFFGFDLGGGGRKKSGRRRGEDIRTDVYIDYKDAAFGKTAVVEVERKELCATCKGEGIKPGSRRKTCTTCGGQGKVRRAQGFFTMVTECPACHGEGEIAENLCTDCKGTGLKTNRKKIEVKIPAGVRDNSYLTIRGEGNTGMRGGNNGDLYVVINLNEHEIFRRNEDELIVDLPITIGQAVMGDEIEIPGLYDTQKIKIPPGAQNEDVITLKSQGFPHFEAYGKGDMHVVIKIITPKNPNSRLKEIFKDVKMAEKPEDYKEVKEFMKKVENINNTGKGEKKNG
jgi:molecular chaperone DnaJ